MGFEPTLVDLICRLWVQIPPGSRIFFAPLEPFQISFRRVNIQGNLVYRQYCLLLALIHIWKKYLISDHTWHTTYLLSFPVCLTDQSANFMSSLVIDNSLIHQNHVLCWKKPFSFGINIPKMISCDSFPLQCPLNKSKMTIYLQKTQEVICMLIWRPVHLNYIYIQYHDFLLFLPKFLEVLPAKKTKICFILPHFSLAI